MRGVFSVVSGTTLRFVSLVAAILGTSTYAFSVLYTNVPSKKAEGRVIYGRCLAIYQRHAGEPAAGDSLRGCTAPYEQAQAPWVLAGLGVLLAAAAGLYLLAPWWIQRRARLVPLAGPRFAALSKVLSDLSATAGLAAEPQFLLDPVAAAPGGLAFGRPGRYRVRLNAGLIPLRFTNPAVFRAIVLHELAHIRNRDVPIAYATVALWRAFVALALLPLAVLVAIPVSSNNYLPLLLEHGIRAAALVAMVYLIRNAVLRTRERYADARAASFDAADGLRVAIEKTKPGRRFGVHPSPQSRLRAINDPVSLLRPSFGEMFGAGLTTMIATGTLATYAALAFGAYPAASVTWLYAPVAAGVLGAVAWRAEVGSMRETVLPAAIAFSLGCLAGDLLAITMPGWGVFGTDAAAGQLPLAGSQYVGGYSPVAAVAGALLLTGGIVCQAAVSAAGAQAWLPRLRQLSTHWMWLAGVAATAIPLGLWLAVWYAVHSVPFLVGRTYHMTVGNSDVPIWEGPGFDAVTVFYPPMVLFQNHPLAIPAIALAWLYPFAARTVNVRRPVLIGLCAVAAFAAVLLAARASLHVFVPERAASAAFAPYFAYSVIALAILAQAVAGGLAASAARPFRLLLGQLAAFITAIGCTVTILAGQVLGGCVPLFRFSNSGCSFEPDAGYLGFLLRRIVIEGALAALIAGFLVKITTRLPVVWRLTAITAVVAVFAATIQVTNATSAFDPVPTASPPAPTAPASPATRPPDQAEIDAAVARFTSGLPAYWRRETAPGPAEGTTFDKPACLPIARNTFIEARDPQRLSTATAYLTNGGRFASSILEITINTYPVPVSGAVFTEAQAALAACPAVTATAKDGLQVSYAITGGEPPKLGEQGWRVNLTFSSSSGSTGSIVTVMIRTGHSLVIASAIAINEPLDEALFLDALTRALSGLS